jgi:DNA-binding response OmpR family regulator
MGKDRILVVDDDPDNRTMIGHFLSNWGYEVDDAKNGKIALEKVAAHPPHLVLLDLEMPEMDGFETCEHLKTNPDTEWIPVIIFTGLEKMPHRVRGFRHGADDYVVKTVEPDELRTRIELVLKRTKKYSSLAGLNTDDDNNNNNSVPVIDAESQPADPVAESPQPQRDLAVSVSLARIPFPEAMRLVLAHGENGIVHVSDGTRMGAVYIVAGEVVHAVARNDQGEEAFYELALWRSGRFDFEETDPGTTRSIQTPTRSLLVESSRRQDAWAMISTKVPSFDLVPKWVPLQGASSIRLTKSDWVLIRLVDGQRTIRDIVDVLDTDIFEAGRVVFSLITVGVLRLDNAADQKDDAFDLIPLRGDELAVTEPFELSAGEWALLSRVDGQKNLASIREVMNVAPAGFMKAVRTLREKGFIRLASRERRARKGA